MFEFVQNQDKKSFAIKKYRGCDTDILIPSNDYGIPITKIGSFAFSDCQSLRSVTIPNGIRFIDQGAFQNCTSLTTLYLPGSISMIGEWAFDDCTSLSTIYFDGTTTMWHNIYIAYQSMSFRSAPVLKVNCTNGEASVRTRWL